MHVHEEDSRFFPKEMIVKRGNFQPVFKQRGHDRVDLLLQEDEVAHHYINALIAFCKRYPAAEPEGSGCGNAGDGDAQIASRHVRFQDVCFVVAAAAEDGENFLIILGYVLGGQGNCAEQQDK